MTGDEVWPNDSHHFKEGSVTALLGLPFTFLTCSVAAVTELHLVQSFRFVS